MLNSKKFQKKTEDFICENCGYKNIGNGYTNHCSRCLYSKHVDINPGDRAEVCGGLMEPIEILTKGQIIFIKHRCQKCGKIKTNRKSLSDSFEEIVRISAKKLGN